MSFCEVHNCFKIFFLRRRQEFFFSTIEVLLPSQLHRSFDNTTTVEGVGLLFFLPKKKMQKVNYSCDPYLFLSNENRDKSIERVVTSHWPKRFFLYFSTLFFLLEISMEWPTHNQIDEFLSFFFLSI